MPIDSVSSAKPSSRSASNRACRRRCGARCASKPSTGSGIDIKPRRRRFGSAPTARASAGSAMGSTPLLLASPLTLTCTQTFSAGKCAGRCAESRQIFVDGLSRLPGVTLSVPDGAFYLFFLVEGEKSALDLAKRVLREARVGLAPGTAFGPAGQGCLRLCFAISPELAREAMARLEGFFTRR